MKRFEFLFVAHGRGNNPLEALEDVMDKAKENPRKAIGPDIEYVEIQPDSVCQLVNDTVRSVCSITPPWNSPVAES